jgi:hypothetical protein
VKFIGLELAGGTVRPTRGAIDVECGGRSGVALRFFEPDDGALRFGGPAKRHHSLGADRVGGGCGPAKRHRSLGADRVGGGCGPAKGRDGEAAGAEPPFVSSSPTIELRVVSGPARGHRSLGVDQARGSCGPARKRQWGHCWPWGTMDYRLWGALARPVVSGGTLQLRRYGAQSQ